MKVFGCFVAWFLIEAEVLASAAGTQEEQFLVAVQALKYHLSSFFKRWKGSHPSDKLTQPGDFTPKMLGDHSERKLKLKGAETWACLLFLHDFMSSIRSVLPAEGLRHIEAAGALIELVRTFQRAGPRLTPAEIASCWRSYYKFCSLTEHLPEMLIPKRHLIIHLLARLPEFGNPMIYSNWYDEHLNKLLKKACNAVSQQTFELALTQSMRHLLRHHSHPGRT